MGIGKTSPGYLLDVNGAGYFSGELRVNTHGITTHIGHSTNGDCYLRSSKGAGKVILQDTGGKVGVGTSTPSYILHVAGEGYSQSQVVDNNLKVAEGNGTDERIFSNRR